MGCCPNQYPLKSISPNDRALFDHLVIAICQRNITAIRSIIENASEQAFNFINHGNSIYHHVVIYSPFYTLTELKTLCHIIHKNHKKLGKVDTISNGTSHVQILKDEKNNYTISYVDVQMANNKNLYTLRGVDALTLLYEIKLAFLVTESIADHLDILVETLNKIKNETTLKKYDASDDMDKTKCIICTVNERNVVINNCRHSSTCKTCTQSLTNCPICRTSIISTEYVYIS